MFTVYVLLLIRKGRDSVLHGPYSTPTKQAVDLLYVVNTMCSWLRRARRMVQKELPRSTEVVTGGLGI